MDKLMLYVPTRGRVDNQLTLRSLPVGWRERTTLVCPPDEFKAHKKNWPDLHNIVTFSGELYKKRELIFKMTRAAKIMMLDDDLTFHLRYGKRNIGVKLWTPDPSDKNFSRAFDRIEELLQTYMHGGISIRFMNNAVKEEYKLNGKALHSLAFDVGTVLDNCQLGRLKYAQDYDYTLQLLRAGYENFIYYHMATNEPKGQGAPGGLDYKKEKDGLAALRMLAKLHPGIVDFSIRPEDGRGKLVVHWKKAIAEGKAKR